MLSMNSQTSEEERAQPAVGLLKGSRLIQQARGLSGSSKTPEVSFPVSSTLLSGQKKRKTDSPVPRRRLSQLRGGDPRFVRPELMLDLRGAGTLPGPRATCQIHRSPSLCPAAVPSTGELLPDSAPVLISPAEPVCTEKPRCAGPSQLASPGRRPPGRCISQRTDAVAAVCTAFPGRWFSPLGFSIPKYPFAPWNRLPALLAASPRLSQKATPRRPSSLPPPRPAAAPQLGSLARRRA